MPEQNRTVPSRVFVRQFRNPVRQFRNPAASRTRRHAGFIIRLAASFALCAVLGLGGIINSDAVNPALFDLSTFASGLSFPAGVQPLANGSVLVQTSPNYGYTPGQLLSFTSTGGGGNVVYTAGAPGLMTGSAQVGNYYAVGNDSSEIGPGGDHSISLLQPGAAPGSPAALIATLNLNYPTPWEHPSVGLAARPTPGVPGSYDLIVNVGAQGDNTATPASSQVTLTGTGFSSIPAASLHGDSLYMITINENGAQPAVTSVQQVATGIRNVFGMTFDTSGNLWFTDNGIDTLPPGSTQPVEPDGEPPQADELDFLAGNQLGVGPPPNYGFPNCYIQYAYGGVPGVPVGSGCVQPVLAFQPVVDSSGTHELEGATQVALAPPTFPVGFNNGVFVGFTGGESPNDEAGMAYYDFGTGQYTQFIQSSNPLIGNIVGLASTGDALFFTDATGSVYELTAASPEPGTGLPAALTLVFAAWRIKRRGPHPADRTRV
jgi:hypothetical protein